MASGKADFEQGKWYGITYLLPQPKSLTGRLIKVVNTDEGRLLQFMGRFPFAVLESDLLEWAETTPGKALPKE